MVAGMKAQVMAALSLPICAIALGMQELMEEMTANTRGSFVNHQLLIWLLHGNSYILQRYRVTPFKGTGHPTLTWLQQ